MVARRHILIGADDHARVGAAVAAAEANTSGEIVTIVAARSDPYHDSVAQWGVLAMFGALALIALIPHGWIETARLALLGWPGEIAREEALLWITAALIVAYLAARLIVGGTRLRYALTPAETRARRVRARALMLFRAGTERRTAARTGVLIYLSLAEHRAEIVADEGIHAKVVAEAWGEAMAALVDETRAGRPAEGMARAVEQVGALLARHFPPPARNPDEIPDALIEL